MVRLSGLKALFFKAKEAKEALEANEANHDSL